MSTSQKIVLLIGAIIIFLRLISPVTYEKYKIIDRLEHLVKSTAPYQQKYTPNRSSSIKIDKISWGSTYSQVLAIALLTGVLMVIKKKEKRE